MKEIFERKNDCGGGVMENLKKCPFCGSEKIEYSIKTTGRWERKYHVAMYCKKCNCYGARTLISPVEEFRWDIEKNESYKELAIEAWNNRATEAELRANVIDEFAESVITEMECFAREQEGEPNTGFIDSCVDIVRYALQMKGEHK